MGLAASQARLLTITARLADNELKSQTINNAKMRLATQSSQASENYISALNNATMKFSNYDLSGNSQTQALTYNALTAYSSYNTQYGLVNSSGQILVSESEAALYDAANGNINAYLKSHGLEYTTTYFDELGEITNDSYPEPFNSISSTELQGYYEEYNSYENSIEVQNYENNYSQYVTASNELINGAKDSMESYLTYNGNSPAVTKNADKEFEMALTSSSVQALLTEFKNAVSGTNSNTYNIENLKAMGILTDGQYNEFTENLNSMKPWSGMLNPTDTTATSGVKLSNNLNPPTYDAETNTYTVDGHTIILDESGNVVSVTFDGSKAATDSDGSSTTYTYTYPAADGSVSFKDFVNNISYNVTATASDGTVTGSGDYKYELAQDSDGNYTLAATTVVTDPEMMKAVLNDSIDSLVSSLKYSANYEAFADFLLTSEDVSKYGIDPNSKLPSSSKTLTDVLNNYKDRKDAFLSNIFDTTEEVVIDGVSYASSKDYIEAALKAGTIEAEKLTDVDEVLKLISELGLKQSSSYNTVIEKYIVDEMIDVYGEPKYAWIDETDTGNTGNADSKAQWYTNLFRRMQEGYKAIENGLASSSEWMEFALESGIVTLEQVDKSFNWNSLDYKTCTRITEETDNDAVTKAEAEYNRAMNDIEAKDNIYDIQLKNIDTEHSSLQTEYESIKGVITKNIERTMKFNQSA